MEVNVHWRAAAARKLLDAVSSQDLDYIDENGTRAADEVLLLALAPLKLELESNPRLAATFAAVIDLLWFVTNLQAQSAGISKEELVSNLRQHVLPMTYPEAYEGP